MNFESLEQLTEQDLMSIYDTSNLEPETISDWSIYCSRMIVWDQVWYSYQYDNRVHFLDYPSSASCRQQSYSDSYIWCPAYGTTHLYDSINKMTLSKNHRCR